MSKLGDDHERFWREHPGERREDSSGPRVSCDGVGFLEGVTDSGTSGGLLDPRWQRSRSETLPRTGAHKLWRMGAPQFRSWLRFDDDGAARESNAMPGSSCAMLECGLCCRQNESSDAKVRESVMRHYLGSLSGASGGRQARGGGVEKKTNVKRFRLWRGGDKACGSRGLPWIDSNPTSMPPARVHTESVTMWRWQMRQDRSCVRSRQDSVKLPEAFHIFWDVVRQSCATLSMCCDVAFRSPVEKELALDKSSTTLLLDRANLKETHAAAGLLFCCGLGRGL